MSTTERNQFTKVGKLRPSQAVTQHGPGAVIDLPELSVIVAGINHWVPGPGDRISEPRLEKFINAAALYRAPRGTEGWYGGVPAFVFPEYLVCPDTRCRRLAPHTAFTESSRGQFRCTSSAHQGLRRVAFPARFLVACPRGHLDDFPWQSWAHGRSGTCGNGDLQLIDLGNTGGVADLLVRCSCGASQRMGTAFQRGAHEGCSGRRPWLGSGSWTSEQCGDDARTLLRGASNAYFAVMTSAISIPPWSDPIHQDIVPFLALIEGADSFEQFKAGVEGGFYKLDPLLEKYTLEQVWEAKSGPTTVETDLKLREYDSLRNPEVASDDTAEFEAHRTEVTSGVAALLDRVVAVTRLREVRALRAFTRIDSIPEVGERHDVSQFEAQLAPIGSTEERWRPATELRGEGIYLELHHGALKAWEARPDVVERSRTVERDHADLWQTRGRDFPGMRFVLLHTLSHVLMRQMSLHAGYSSSALRERVYCGPQMAGLLIYTASGDSDGSLGGLVDLARPQRLAMLLEEALEDARFCASDPLCSTGESSPKGRLNGAACHACLLMAETSCEAGNRMLDRAVLVHTLAEERDGLAFAQ